MRNRDADKVFHVQQPHAQPAEAVFDQLKCSADGLAGDEVVKRLEVVGPNRLPTAPKEGLLKRFFKHFHDLLIYI